MNKKFLCGALACMMAFSSVFALAACKDKGPQGNTGNNGGGSMGGNGTTIKPGTVITDESIKTDLYGTLSQSELKGFTYSASATLGVTMGGSAQTQKIVAEGAALITDTAVEVDVFAYFDGVSGEDKESQYMLFFLRDGATYVAMGDWSEEGEVDFAKLKTQLKAEKDPLVLGKEEFDSAGAGLMTSPAALKMVKNLPSLFDGVVTKTEGGYALKFGVLDAVKSLFDGVGSLATAIDANAQITLSGLFGQPFLKTTLGKLLSGITAKEFVDTIKPMLPEEIAKALPEATTGTAVAYVEGLLRSGAFYKALTGDGDEWKEWQTFAEVPLASIASIFTGEEVSFGDLKLKEMLDDLEENFEEQLVSMLLGLIQPDEGELSDENIDLMVSFSFDEDKKLLGFSIDGLVTGSRTLGSKEQPEEGEKGEQEDNQESELPSPTAKTKSDNTATARGTVKIEAACVSAPELYDLVGCKYYTEDGGKATIPAKK